MFIADAVCNNFIFKKEHKRIKHRQHSIIHEAREHHIFQVYKSICFVDLRHNSRVFKLDNLMKFRFILQV